MKTPVAALGLALSLTTGCGGSVIFEEDGGNGGSGGDGGNGASGTVTSTNVGPGGGDGGAGTSSVVSSSGISASSSVVSSSGITASSSVVSSSGITSSVTSNVTVSASSGVPGCGSLGEAAGLPPACNSCLDSFCCDQLLACDEGTACWDCIFENFNCGVGEPLINELVSCLEQSCSPECNGQECGPNDFVCPENGQCIPAEWECDGIVDCPEGSDELCGGCGPDEFQCPESGECIPGQWVCDGFFDCPEGSDEFCGCGPSDFQCFNSGECIPEELVCNGLTECQDGTDELSCGECQPGEFQCFESLECIPGSWTCDQIVDCADGSDEQCGEGVLITAPGVAYGHHGECAGWNGCGDAETCAQWACQVEGFGTLASFGEDRPCTEWDNCHLFFDGCCGGVDYDWGNSCEVRGVSEIRCIP